MKLGEVLKKEREKKGTSLDDMASALGISSDEYQTMEAGESDAETWGPVLAQIAIELETPTSRLLAESGRSTDCKAGQAGPLIKGHRERRKRSEGDLIQALGDYGVDAERYAEIEAGTSGIEVMGPRFLAFAEAIEQPVFNLFYPCGLPFQELDDYP